MIYKENECVGCPPELGCLGSACPKRNAIHVECDCCHCEVSKLFWVGGGEQWCKDCIIESYDEVDIEREVEE